MKIITNGYPVESANGTIWIVEVNDTVTVAPAKHPDYTYTVSDEDEATDAIEDGSVLDESWQLDHGMYYYGGA